MVVVDGHGTYGPWRRQTPPLGKAQLGFLVRSISSFGVICAVLGGGLKLTALPLLAAGPHLSDGTLRSVYALTVLRLVNGVVDPSQKGRCASDFSSPPLPLLPTRGAHRRRHPRVCRPCTDPAVTDLTPVCQLTVPLYRALVRRAQLHS